jgi:hypothetical protein
MNQQQNHRTAVLQGLQFPEGSSGTSIPLCIKHHDVVYHVELGSCAVQRRIAA